MSSSNAANIAGSAITISAPTGMSYSYTPGVGIGAINQVMDTSTIQSGKEYIEEPTIVLSVENGEPYLSFYETENHRRIKMVLEPEAGMSVSEKLKIDLMTQVMKESALRLRFSPLAYIRRHNLERHFRFSA